MTDIPVRVGAAAAALSGAPADAGGLDRPLAAAAAAMAELDAVADLDGSPDYKRHLAGVLVGRATMSAVQEATARA